MCDNLMSEAEFTVMEKVGSASGSRLEELKEAVERAVEEGRVLMDTQERRSLEQFNDDSEYSKMLHEAVQVRTLPFVDKVVMSNTDPRRCCWLCGIVSRRWGWRCYRHAKIHLQVKGWIGVTAIQDWLAGPRE